MAETAACAIEVWDQARLEAERCGSLLAVARGSAARAAAGDPRTTAAARQIAAAGPRRQGRDVRLGRPVAQADRRHEDDEVRHGRRGDGAGGDAGHRPAEAAGQRDRPGAAWSRTCSAATRTSWATCCTARSGKTIEVLNTDAEGRLVLADVLDVAVDRKPAQDHRPGHADRGLRRGPGQRRGRPDDQRPGLVRRACRPRPTRAASRSGNCRCSPSTASRSRAKWPTSRTSATAAGRGAITAAKFLEEFVGGKPWVHISTSPARRFLKSRKPWLDAGGSGRRADAGGGGARAGREDRIDSADWRASHCGGGSSAGAVRDALKSTHAEPDGVASRTTSQRGASLAVGVREWPLGPSTAA